MILTEKQLALKHPHIFAIGYDGVLEMYLDHHMLSTMRTCEAKFYEEQLVHIGGRGQRYYSLEFGLWFHECLDVYYKAFKDTGEAPKPDEWVAHCMKLWDAYDINSFAPPPGTLTSNMYGDAKKYYNFAKWEPRSAVARLLIEYHAYYMDQRMRVVDTEISFGRAREVFLGSFKHPGDTDEDLWNEMPVRCYLTGRIDLLADNGNKIGPVDHKSTAKFDGYESNDFDPHEGITGYIFAINSILQARAEQNAYNGVPRSCNSGWIYHISIQDASPRFKPTPIYKTNQQLAEYQQRQVRTCRRIYELAATTPILEDYGQIEFDTMKCNNIYNSPCPFRELHRQPFGQRQGTINQFYEIKPAWNPEKKDKIRLKAEENMTKSEDKDGASTRT